MYCRPEKNTNTFSSFIELVGQAVTNNIWEVVLLVLMLFFGSILIGTNVSLLDEGMGSSRYCAAIQNYALC